MAAWREIGRVVTEVGWALLIAPELWCVLEEWFACRRLERDAQRMRRLRNRVQRAAEDPAFRDGLEGIGNDAVFLGPRAFADMLPGDVRKWDTLVKAIGAKLD